MFYLLSIIKLSFLYINFLIIKSNIKTKKINNFFLLSLFFIAIFYNILNFIIFNVDINFFNILSNLLINIFICFLLYYFSIWSAWTAKYLLVLTLFITNENILTLLWNTIIVLLFYLILYFFYFYIFKIILNKNARISFFKSIKIDLKDKFKTLKKNKWKFFIIHLLSYFIYFISIYLTIKIVLFFIIEKINNNFNFPDKLIPFIILLLIFIIYYLKKIINNDILKNNKLYIIIFLIFISSYIGIIEYNNNIFQNYIIKLFTLYLLIYFLIEIIKYSYNILYWLEECEIIDLKDLKQWDFIDKKYLITNYKLKANIRQLKKLPFNIKGRYKKRLIRDYSINFFNKEIKDPLDKESIEKLKSILNNIKRIQKKYFKKNINIKIKIIKTFSLSPFIFIWFILTYLYWTKIIEYIIYKYLQIIS